MRLAEQVPLEIVSIDSAQVYRGMDIGTAKPTAAERAAVPHHLIDIREPAEPYSVAEFVRDATAAIQDIRTRGRLPLVVGGTMLYAKVLREGLSALPTADPQLRARLDAEARVLGWPALHARLAAADPATAARLPPYDSQRIQRALEIHELTGSPMSELIAGDRSRALASTTIALIPSDRAELHRRIEQRFDAMLAAGLLDEVRVLRAQGQRRDLPSMRSVGYRQALQHLDGKLSFAEFRAAGIAATRQLAKRQITWLRSMRDAIALDPFAPAAFATVLALAQPASH
jgi:tRNA dimethylallyltransferase